MRVSELLVEGFRTVSPRHLRWRRLLASLTLDPESLAPLAEGPGSRDFLICGLPRSGTALLSAALYQPPGVVTVMEPWDAFRLPPAELFRSLRAEIAGGVLRRGRLDVGALLDAGDVRWCRDGACPHPVSVTSDYLLGIKLPAFWRYLDLLPTAKFLVCLRDPVETVASYRSVGGRLAEGLDYDVAFNRRMNDWLLGAATDVAVRRVLLYDYVASRLAPHLARPNVLVVRYERWFTEADVVLTEIGRFLGVELSHNRVVLRAPKNRRPGEGDDLDLVSAHSRMAETLGYPVRASD